jgi:hypothetical protein
MDGRIESHGEAGDNPHCSPFERRLLSSRYTASCAYRRAYRRTARFGYGLLYPHATNRVVFS